VYAELDFFIILFLLGGVFTTSLYCFITYFSRGREKLFLGYSFFTLSTTLLLFARRVLPAMMLNGGGLVSNVLTLVFILAVVGSSLYYFLVFFDISRSRRAFRILIAGFFLVFATMSLAIAGLVTGNGGIFIPFFYCACGMLALSGLLYIIRSERSRKIDWRSRKPVVYILAASFAVLLLLSVLNAIFEDIPFYLTIPQIYAVVIIFFIFHGDKLKRDFRELIDLKAELEEKVRVRTEQVEELRRKEQRFFITITHETKTPLTLVSGCLERYMASAPGHPDLDLMRRTLDSLRASLANHLDFEKLLGDAAHFDHGQTADFAWLMREKIRQFQPLAQKKGLRLEAALPEELSVSADPAALDRLANNLIENAIKYTMRGGRIAAALERRGTGIILTVRDTGIGMSKELRERAFDPLIQGPHRGSGAQGVGMGLAIVKQIVTSLGGAVEIRSSLAEADSTGAEPAEAAMNGGAWVTEVEASFPASIVIRKPGSMPDNAYAPSEPVETVVLDDVDSIGLKAAHDPSRPTVLIVEDDRELLHFMVESLGARFNAYGAANGREALERMGSLPRPDIVISDIVMDEMDGYAFLAALREMPSCRDLPFVFLTAVSSSVEKLKSLSGGAIDFLPKPLTGIAELEAKITSVLDLLERRSERNREDIFRALGRAIEEERTALPRQESVFRENMAAYGLSERERLIAECLREGLQNKEISARLGTSTRTVDNHLYNIYRKAKVQNRVELLNRLLTRR